MSSLDDAMDEHMAFIVLMEKRPVSFKDFLCFKVGENEYKIAHKTFRNKILSRKKKQIVELDYNCGTAYYTLKGHRFRRSVTRDHTGVRSFKTIANVNVNSNVYKMLESLPLDKQSIHNIRLRFTAPGIWTSLSNCSDSNYIHMNQRSQDIVFPAFAFSRAGAVVQVKVH